MDWFNENMHEEEDEFRQFLERYEDMVERKLSMFFDVEEFEQIIDYYIDIRNFRKASEAVGIAERQHPGSTEITLKRIQIFLETSQPSRAIDELNRITEWDSETPDVYLLRGTALAQLGKIAEAEKQFDLALGKTGVDKVDILINISMAFENARKYNIAIKYLRTAYALDPTNLTILYDLGFYYERLHEYETSIGFYNKYLDEDPFSDNVWYNLGVVYYKVNKTAKAIEAYDYAIAINPSYASAYFNKANIYANDSDFKNAITVYQDFLELEDDHIQAWCYLGECYDQIESFDLALKTYKRVIEIDNTTPEGWFGAGISYLSLGNFNDALAYILKAIELDTNNSDYWFHLGETYQAMDSLTEAAKCFSKAVEIDPKDDQAWFCLARIFYLQKDYVGTVELLGKVFVTIPENPELLCLEAASYFQLNGWSFGLLSLKKALLIEKNVIDEFYKLYPRGLKNKKIQDLLENLS